MTGAGHPSLIDMGKMPPRAPGFPLDHRVSTYCSQCKISFWGLRGLWPSRVRASPLREYLVMLCHREATLIRSKDLKAFDLFADLDLDQIELVRSCCEEQMYDVGDSVFVDGGEATHLYLVQKGRIAIRMERRPKEMIDVFYVTPGLFCGWSSVVPPYIMTFHGDAIEATKAILVNGSDLRRICEGDPRIGYKVMQAVAKVVRGRLCEARARLVSGKAVGS